MSSSVAVTDKELESLSFKEYLESKNVPLSFNQIIEIYMGMSIWTELSIPITLLETVFVRVPFVAAPAVITDVGLGIGNLAEQYNLESVKPSDIIDLGSSIVSFVGGYAYLAAIGIETTAIGMNLIKIGSSTTSIGWGLLIGGLVLDYAVDHAPEFIDWLGEGYSQLKENYKDASSQFDSTKNKLIQFFGEKLFNILNNANHENLDKAIYQNEKGEFIFDFDYLDPNNHLGLKEKLKIDPSWLLDFLKNTKDNFSFIKEALYLNATDSICLENEQEKNNSYQESDFIFDKSRAVFRVDAHKLSDSGLKILALDLKDLDNNLVWIKKDVETIKDSLPNLELDSPLEATAYNLKNTSFFIVTKGDGFAFVKNSQILNLQFPILQKENKILALKDIASKDDNSNKIFKFSHKSEAPHCGNFVKHAFGPDLFYYCIYHNKAEPSIGQINNHFSNIFEVV